MAHRYAVYLAPAADSALWRFGSTMVGYDAETGAEPSPPDLPGFDAANWRAMTAEPRRYGFHGTLKAPFRLAEGRSEAELLALTEACAAEHHGFELPPLKVSAIGAFLALVPPVPVPALADLARCTVLDLEPVRAPLSEAEIAKRRPERLSPRQRQLLDAYGYPYVEEEFRFHMTLTGPLDPALQAHALRALSDAFAGSGAAAPLRISDVALYVEDEPGGRFRLARRFALGAGR